MVTQLAEGCAGVNVFIFCDGQNPESGGEGMLPEKNMNYQAPITVVGRRRDSYYAVKRIGWFIRSFGEELLKSVPDPTWARARAFGIPHPGVSDGGDLFAGSERADCTVDGAHPNDIGFRRMADVIGAKVAEILGIEPNLR